MLSRFFHRPQATLLRRVLFQVHLWSGLALALYVILVGVTGSVLVFRHELEAWFYPQFYEAPHQGQPLADPAVVLRNIEAAYPGFRVGTVNWPAPFRDTFVSYPSRPGDVRTVFAHPVTGEVIGELPRSGLVYWMREAHVYLLLPRGNGTDVNGILCALLGVSCLAGLIIWWPGISRWTRGLIVDMRRGWRRINFDLHSAVGFWTSAVLLIWAVSGLYLTFSGEFRSVVDAMTLSSPRSAAPQSTPSPHAADVEPSVLVSRALAAVPDAAPARYIRPSSERGAAVVLLARDAPGDRVTSDEVSVYFDRYTGELLEVRPEVTAASDLIVAWQFPLHAGWFAGMGVKVLWAILGFVYPLLVVTGTIMWWNRKISRRTS